MSRDFKPVPSLPPVVLVAAAGTLFLLVLAGVVLTRLPLGMASWPLQVALAALEVLLALGLFLRQRWAGAELLLPVVLGLLVGATFLALLAVDLRTHGLVDVDEEDAVFRAEQGQPADLPEGFRLTLPSS